MPRPKKSFSPEFKDEAVKMVIETSRPIARVAKELGINEGTLGNWVGIYRREHVNIQAPGLGVAVRDGRLRFGGGRGVTGVAERGFGDDSGP